LGLKLGLGLGYRKLQKITENYFKKTFSLVFGCFRYLVLPVSNVNKQLNAESLILCCDSVR